MKVRFVSGPTTMPVAQNTPRTTRGTHHAFTKWKMRTLTREAAPTATTASRIEIGIRVTMLGHLKCLPNQPASNRMKSAYLRRGNRIGRNKKGSGRHLGPSILCHKPTAAWFLSRERSSLRQHDLDGTHVRRAAVLRGHLLRRDADISHLGIGDEAPADDLTGPRLGFPFGGGPHPVLRPRGREGPQSGPVDRRGALRRSVGARPLRHVHLAAPVDFSKLF